MQGLGFRIQVLHGFRELGIRDIRGYRGLGVKGFRVSGLGFTGFTDLQGFGLRVSLVLRV